MWPEMHGNQGINANTVHAVSKEIGFDYVIDVGLVPNYNILWYGRALPLSLLSLKTLTGHSNNHHDFRVT
jgi:hypothetical protein